jgi:hypothetical protein
LAATAAYFKVCSCDSGNGVRPFGQVGDRRHAGHLQAAVTRRDHFRHHRHADHVGAQRLEGADFGGGLEVRARAGQVDAFVQGDALVRGGGLHQLAHVGVVGIGHAEEARAEALVVRAGHRAARQQVDVVGQRTTLPASTSGRSEPAALVTNSSSQPISFKVRTAEVITPGP